MLHHLRGVPGSFALFLGHPRHFSLKVEDGIRQGFRRNHTVGQTLLQRIGETLGISHQLVKGVSALSGHHLDRLDKASLVSDTLVQQLFPARTKAAAEKLISRLGRFTDDTANGVGNLGQQFLGFFKVANQNLPRRGPSRLRAFLQRVPQLRERLYFGSGVFGRLRHLSDLFRLSLRETLLNQIGLGVRSGKLLQSLGKDLGGKPLASGKGLPEGTIHVDGVLCPSAQQLRSPNQSILEHLAAHAGVDHRVPVHQGYSARGQRLGKLIHRRRGLLRGRARNSSQVGNTLNGVH